YRDETRRDVRPPVFREKLLDDLLRLVIVPFTEMMVPDTAFSIDEIVRGPILIAEGAPDRIVAVDSDRVSNFKVRDGLLHIAGTFFEGEFRRVYADDNEALIFVLLSPSAHIGDRPQTIDAGIGPEIDQDHFAFEPLSRKRRRI